MTPFSSSGRGHWCHSLVDLPCCSGSRAEQGAPPRGNQYSDRAVERAGQSREFAALFLQGVRSFHDLDGPDKLRFSAFFTRFTRNCEGMFIYYRDGALEKPLWDEVERTISDYFAYPGVKEWWSTRKHWLTDEFRAVVEVLIAKNPEAILYAAYKLDAPPKA